MQSKQAPEAASERQARILVVEDEPMVRFAVADALRDLGACVVEAATADEAWGYLIGGEPVDLIFTDHRMPGSMMGGQFAMRVRRHFPSIAIIVTSGDFQGDGWPEPVLKKPYPLVKTASDLVRLALDRKTKD